MVKHCEPEDPLHIGLLQTNGFGELAERDFTIKGNFRCDFILVDCLQAGGIELRRPLSIKSDIGFID